MSAQAILPGMEAFFEAPELSTGARRLLEVMRGYARGGKCFPKQTTLAGVLGWVRRTVSRYVAELKRAGLVVVRRGRTSAVYENVVELVGKPVEKMGRISSNVSLKRHRPIDHSTESPDPPGKSSASAERASLTISPATMRAELERVGVQMSQRAQRRLASKASYYRVSAAQMAATTAQTAKRVANTLTSGWVTNPEGYLLRCVESHYFGKREAAIEKPVATPVMAPVLGPVAPGHHGFIAGIRSFFSKVKGF